MPSSSFYDICSNQDSIGWENADLNYYKSSLLWRNKSDGFFPKKWAVGTSCYHMFSHWRCVILLNIVSNIIPLIEILYILACHHTAKIDLSIFIKYTSDDTSPIKEINVIL